MVRLRNATTAVLLRFGLLVASLLLVLALGEGYARLVWQAPPARPERARHPPEPGMATFESLFDLAKANRRGLYKGVIHETNDRGIRGPDRTLAPGPGVVRIAVGGDSITMGWGVEEPDTYVARLERMLRSESSGRSFEVLNVGLAGLDAATGIERLARFADVYHAGVVVWGFTCNDIEGRRFEQLTTDRELRRRSVESYRYRRSRSYLVRLVGPSYRILIDRLAGRIKPSVRELEHNYFDDPAAAEHFEAALDRLAALVAVRRHCGLVLVHTQLGELGLLHPWRRIYRHVEQLGRERGLKVVQSYPAFSGMDEPPLWVGPFDPHPNAEGHRILAEVLREGLRELLEHCFSPWGPAER